MEKYAKLFETTVRKTQPMIQEGSFNNMQEILDHYLGHFIDYIKLFIFSSEKNELSAEGKEFNSYLDDEGVSVYKTIYPTFYNLVESYEKGIDKKTYLQMYPSNKLTSKLNDKIMKLYNNDSLLNEKEKKLLKIAKDAIRKKIASIKKSSSYYSPTKSSSYYSPTKSSSPMSSSQLSSTPMSSSSLSSSPMSSSQISSTTLSSTSLSSTPKSSTSLSSTPKSSISPAKRLSSLSRLLSSRSSRKSVSSPAQRVSSLSRLLSSRSTQKSFHLTPKSNSLSSGVVSLKNRKRCQKGYRKHPSIPGKCKKILKSKKLVTLSGSRSKSDILKLNTRKRCPKGYKALKKKSSDGRKQCAKK